MKHLLLTLFLACGLALANGLKAYAADGNTLDVTLMTTSGAPPVTYTLDAQDTKEFWRRWRTLKPTTSMVPAPDNGTYRGLSLRESGGIELRLFSGVVQMNDDLRADAGRLLERFVLTLAPPPLGQTLARGIDATGGAGIGRDAQDAKPNRLSAKQIIAKCKDIAGERWDLRTACLENTLAHSLKPEVFGPALEKMIKSLSAELPLDPSDEKEALTPKIAAPIPPKPPQAKPPVFVDETAEAQSKPSEPSDADESAPRVGRMLQIPISELGKLYGPAP